MAFFKVMKMRTLLLALLLVPSFAFAATLYDWKVYRVIDGDTIKFTVDFLPKDLGQYLSIRVDGIDTPEKNPRSKCPKEHELAMSATNFTKKAIKDGKKIQVEIHSWDKYGGRVLGDVIIDGQRLSTLLIKGEKARPYDGGKKSDWCN